MSGSHPVYSNFFEGTEVHLAPLATIDFSRLSKRDPGEIRKLLISCKKHGFFYLILANGEVGQIGSIMQKILSLMGLYFDAPQEVKMKNAGSLTSGYFPMGSDTGLLENTRDAYEGFRIPQYDLKGKLSALPAPFRANETLFMNFISLSNHVLLTILSCLSDAIDLENVGRLEDNHLDDKPNKSILTMHRYPKDPGPNNFGHNAHTDIGTLTLVLTEQWGLQVLVPETKTWCFVEPKPGLAVVNIGDALRFMSGKRFYSALHRVVPVDWQELPRYSICYFLRPNNDVKFKDMNGSEVSAEQWHDIKQIVHQEAHERQFESGIITGGMESEI